MAPVTRSQRGHLPPEIDRYQPDEWKIRKTSKRKNKSTQAAQKKVITKQTPAEKAGRKGRKKASPKRVPKSDPRKPPGPKPAPKQTFKPRNRLPSLPHGSSSSKFGSGQGTPTPNPKSAKINPPKKRPGEYSSKGNSKLSTISSWPLGRYSLGPNGEQSSHSSGSSKSIFLDSDANDDTPPSSSSPTGSSSSPSSSARASGSSSHSGGPAPTVNAPAVQLLHFEGDGGDQSPRVYGTSPEYGRESPSHEVYYKSASPSTMKVYS